MPVKETTGEEAIAEINEQATALENTGAEQQPEEKTDDGEAAEQTEKQQQAEENAGDEQRAKEAAETKDVPNTNATEDLPFGKGPDDQSNGAEEPK